LKTYRNKRACGSIAARIHLASCARRTPLYGAPGACSPLPGRYGAAVVINITRHRASDLGKRVNGTSACRAHSHDAPYPSAA